MRLRSVIPMLVVLTMASAPVQATDIVVIHGIPLDAAANVDLCATLPSGDTTRVITGFNFGDYADLRGLPGVTYSAKVVGGGMDCSAAAAFDLAIGPVNLDASAASPSWRT